MNIPDNEWGELREDVGYIKAKIEVVDTHEQRISSLERDNVRELAVVAVSTKRRAGFARFRAEIVATIAALGALAAVVAPYLH